MIWLVAYLMVGMAFALYMPIKQRRSQARINAMDALDFDKMDNIDRRIFNVAASVVMVDYTTTQIVVGGLLWPIQVIAVIAVEIMIAVRRARNGCDH